MAVDFFAKEVEKLRNRFNGIYGERTIFDLRSRQACILAICRASLLSQSIRDRTDEKGIGETTRELCAIRETLNRFFDRMEEQQERRLYVGKHVDGLAIAAG